MVDASYIKNIAPEFSSVTDERINFFIQLAQLQVNQSVFLRTYDLAVAYLSAHMLSMSPDPTTNNMQTAQIVTSEKVGDLSRNYQQKTTNSSDSSTSLSLTRYGEMFLALRKACVISPIVITGSGSLNE